MPPPPPPPRGLRPISTGGGGVESRTEARRRPPRVSPMISQPLFPTFLAVQTRVHIGDIRFGHRASQGPLGTMWVYYVGQPILADNFQTTFPHVFSRANSTTPIPGENGGLFVRRAAHTCSRNQVWPLGLPRAIVAPCGEIAGGNPVSPMLLKPTVLGCLFFFSGNCRWSARNPQP